MGGSFMLIITTVKLIVPKINETHAKCNEKMLRFAVAHAYAQ